MAGGVGLGQSSPGPQSSRLVGQVPQADPRPRSGEHGHEVPTPLSPKGCCECPFLPFSEPLPWLSLLSSQEGTNGGLPPMG